MAEARLTTPRASSEARRPSSGTPPPAGEASRPAGRAALYALPVAATLAMLGIVVGVNPGRYGAVGSAAGALLALAAAGVALRAFRRAGRSASQRENEQPEGET